MRKRSKYKPKAVIVNTLAFVTKGVSKLTDNPEEDLRIRLIAHTALQSVIDDKGTQHDLNALVGAATMTVALSRRHGADWEVEILAGAKAVEAMRLRLAKWGKVQATTVELEAIKLMLQIHDAQLDASTIIDVEKAIDSAEKMILSTVRIKETK